MTPRQPFVASLGILLICLSGGCTATKPVTIGLYARGDVPVIRHAPESGVYKVQWLSADRKEIRTCVGSDRVIGKGEPLGFAAGPNGQVTAIAGIEQFPLEHLPSHAQFCRWNITVERETHFGRDLQAAAVIARDSAALVATVAVLGGLAYVDSKLEDGWGVGGGGVDRSSSGPGGNQNAPPHSPASRKSE